jgi:hypothetical protein
VCQEWTVPFVVRDATVGDVAAVQDGFPPVAAVEAGREGGPACAPRRAHVRTNVAR